jgi:glycosyltransferase involved in cell wall biosynthesis
METTAAPTSKPDRAQPLRIWHLVESYPPQYGGGAAITTRDICRVQAHQGNEVRVLCLDSSSDRPYELSTDYDGTIRIDRLSLPYFNAAKDPEGIWMGLGNWRRHSRRVCEVLDQLLDEWTPDVVDYHVIRPFGEECLDHLSKRALPIVATLHDGWLLCSRLFLLQSPGKTACTGPGPLKCLTCAYTEYEGSLPSGLAKLPWRILRRGAMPAYRQIRRQAVRSKVDGAITRSEFIAAAHRPHLSGPIRVVPIGIDLTSQELAPVQRPRRPFRFGFLGGTQPHKGFSDVLTACAELKRQRLSFELHVWGPGLDRSADLIRRLGLEGHIVLRGLYEHRELWKVYGEIDLAVMATRVCESFGRIVYEAAAAGIPAIAPAVGGLPEQIRHRENGLLFRFLDPDDLGQQMRAILEEDGLFERLMNNVAVPPSMFDTVGEIEGFYREVLQSRRTPRADHP